MLSTAEVSVIMCDMQGVSIETIEEDGSVFPSLIIMNVEHPIKVDDLPNRYNNILTIEYSPKLYGAYVTRITLRNFNEKEDAAIEEIAKEICFRHSPDSIGYVAQCLYKPMKLSEAKKTTDDMMNLDPDVIRVLHNCFFIREDLVTGYLMVTPYLKTQSTKVSEEPVFDFGESTSEESHVMTIEKPWEVSTKKLATKISNPYVLNTYRGL